MKIVFILFLLLFYIPVTYAQRVCIDCNVDSLKVLWKNVKTPADSLYMFTFNVDNGTIGSATYNRREVLEHDLIRIIELNQSLHLIDDRPYQLLLAGLNHWQKNEKREAIESMKQAIELFDKQQKIFGSWSILSELRSYYSNAGLSEERFEYYTQKLKQYSEHGPIENTGPCYHALGGYYLNHRNDYNLALKYYLKAAEVYKLYSLSEYTNELTIIGQVYYYWGNNERSIYYLELAEPLIKLSKRRNLEIILNQILSKIERDNGNYDKAVERIDTAIRVAYLVGADPIRAISLSEKGGLLLQMNKPDEALKYLDRAKAIRDSIPFNLATPEGFFLNDLYRYKYYVGKHNFANAETILAKAVIEAEAEKTNILIQKFRQELILFYNRIGHFEKASLEAEKFLTLQDTLKLAQNSLNIASYENEQIELARRNEVEKIEREKARQKNYFILGLISLFVLALFILNSLRLARKARKQVEEKNKQVEAARESAEQSEKFKQQFLANMSHEIRTPMNAVMGMTHLLLAKEPRKDQYPYLDGIKNSSNNLLHIINDILDLAKIEAGKMAIENIDFSLPDVIGQVEQLLQHKAVEKGLQWIVEIDNNIPILLGDPVRVYQVLMNLTGNAIKFTDKGSVHIIVKISPSDQATDLVSVQFTVTDTGIGIARDKLELVFEDFRQAHTSDSRKYGGTGLGLSISKQLIELLGGNISIQSEEHRGTTFSFLLHFQKGSEERLEHRNHPEADLDGSILDGLKVLIADDNAYNLIVASDTLKLHADISIQTATTGKEVIALLQENDFDVILMDVQMPEWNGFEATQYIRTHFASPKKDIPIIAFTASVLRTDLDKCRQAGMNSYIAKPFTTTQLIKGIADVLNMEVQTLPYTRRDNQNEVPIQTPDSKVTDLTYLKDFCHGDPDAIKKYTSIFLQAAPEFIIRLQTALPLSDYTEIASQIHGFSTKFMMFGMHASKELGTKIELECRSESPDEIHLQTNLLKLIAIVEQAVAELNQMEPNV